MINSQYLETFEETLQQLLLQKCSSLGVLDGQLFEVAELDELWHTTAPEYIADAMPNLNDYPLFAVGCATYFGMAMAAIWDGAWDEYSKLPNIYTSIRDVRGFDQMDEYILEDMLSVELSSDYNKKMEDIIRSCAQGAISHIQKEQIEAGTTEAFYVFASTVKVMFKIGVALELKQLGYHYEKVQYSADPSQVN